MVKKLQAARSPAATMLERRVDLVERLQVLMFRKIRSLPRPEVVAHTTAVQAFGCGLPFRVRLDILEVQVEGQCSDYFACNVGGEQLESMAADIVSKFCYWKKAEGQINESDMTIIHALTAEDELHQQRRLANEITEDEEKGLKNSITEVRREC